LSFHEQDNFALKIGLPAEDLAHGRGLEPDQTDAFGADSENAVAAHQPGAVGCAAAHDVRNQHAGSRIVGMNAELPILNRTPVGTERRALLCACDFRPHEQEQRNHRDKISRTTDAGHGLPPRCNCRPGDR
jgi:hypothetical protein